MKKTNKNNNKKKLSSLILLLAITIVMLGTATWAWFTANKTVTISTLDVHVEAQSGLQVSADAFEWKTVLSNADIVGAKAGNYGGAINQIPAVLEPVSTAGLVNNTTGFLEMFNGVVGKNNDGDFTLATTAAVEANGSTGMYIAFDMFLKTEQDVQIYLTTDSSVAPKALATNKGLQNSARVGFVHMGEAASDTPYQTLQTLNSWGSNDVYIWEPNYDVHTTHGVIAAAAYGITTTVGPNAARVTYDGAMAPTTADIKVYEANATNYPTLFKTVTPTTTTKAIEDTYQTAFELKAGVTKMRVYMWIEGQDVDCENNASGTDISFNVQLSTTSQP